jgi:hypothetical protein
MSTPDPLDDIRDRCNKMCNDIWKYTDHLSEKLHKVKEETLTKEIWTMNRDLLNMIADLYVSQAASISYAKATREMFKPLWKEVFGDKEIQLPYELEAKTLSESLETLKRHEKNLEWLEKFFKKATTTKY